MRSGFDYIELTYKNYTDIDRLFRDIPQDYSDDAKKIIIMSKIRRLGYEFEFGHGQTQTKISEIFNDIMNSDEYRSFLIEWLKCNEQVLKSPSMIWNSNSLLYMSELEFDNTPDGSIKFAYNKRYYNYILQYQKIKQISNEYYISFTYSDDSNIQYIIEYCELKLLEGNKVVNIYIDSINNPRDLLKYRLVPNYMIGIEDISLPYNINYNEILGMIYLGYSDNEIRFWYHVDTDITIDDILRRIRVWSYISKKFIRDNLIPESKSVPILFTFPDMLYSSNRPITNMEVFQTPYSNYYNNINDMSFISNNYIHVTRYSSGMSRGLYKRESTQEFCGTFYYLEPESTTLLICNYITMFNKFTTARYFVSNYSHILSRELINDFNEKIEEIISYSPIILDWSEGRIRDDFKYTPTEMEQIFNPMFIYKHDKYPKSNDYIEPLNRSNEKRFYVGNRFLYSREDGFDQPLCLAMQELGIEVLILTHMIGSHQVVTEVLDARDRTDSFNNLWFKRDN